MDTQETTGLTLMASDEAMMELKEALTSPRVEALLLDRELLAKALGDISTDTIDRWDAAAVLPPPVSLAGRRKLWSKAEVAAWIVAGCPDRETWAALMKSNNTQVVARR